MVRRVSVIGGSPWGVMVSMGGGSMAMVMGYGYIKDGWNSLFLGGLEERGCFWGMSCYGDMLRDDKKAYMLY